MAIAQTLRHFIPSNVFTTFVWGSYVIGSIKNRLLSVWYNICSCSWAMCNVSAFGWACSWCVAFNYGLWSRWHRLGTHRSLRETRSQAGCVGWHGHLGPCAPSVPELLNWNMILRFSAPQHLNKDRQGQSLRVSRETVSKKWHWRPLGWLNRRSTAVGTCMCCHVKTEGSCPTPAQSPALQASLSSIVLLQM